MMSCVALSMTIASVYPMDVFSAGAARFLNEQTSPLSSPWIAAERFASVMSKRRTVEQLTLETMRADCTFRKLFTTISLAELLVVTL